MNLFKRLFGGNKNEVDSIIAEFEFDEIEKLLFQDFVKLDKNNKIKRIMAYADSGEMKYYKLFKYSIIYETDTHIKFAALKRLYLFKAHSDCIPMIISLKNRLNISSLEPYYSMALSKMELISLDEFRKRVDPR
jgi:hypothetical protein